MVVGTKGRCRKAVTKRDGLMGREEEVAWGYIIFIETISFCTIVKRRAFVLFLSQNKTGRLLKFLFFRFYIYCELIFEFRSVKDTNQDKRKAFI